MDWHQTCSKNSFPSGSEMGLWEPDVYWPNIFVCQIEISRPPVTWRLNRGLSCNSIFSFEGFLKWALASWVKARCKCVQRNSLSQMFSHTERLFPDCRQVRENEEQKSVSWANAAFAGAKASRCFLWNGNSTFQVTLLYFGLWYYQTPSPQ